MLGGAIAYANSLHGAFVYDDILSIVDNPALRRLAHLGAVLSPAGEAATVQGRPFLGLTLAVNYALGGLNPAGYHLFNLAEHLLAGLALYAIARAVTGRAGLAGAVALLWTVHPLQTEAVTYVVQRAESLMGLCYLATAYFYIRYAETPRPGWAAAAVAACLAGMATKEVMVSAPLLLWMFDRAYLAGSFRAAWRARGGLLLALAATWAPLAWFVAAAGGNRGGSVGFGLDIRPLDYWLTQGEAVLHYLRLVVWPAPLVFDYGRIVPAHPLAALAQVAAVAALLAASVWAWRRAPRAGFLALFFFAILAPTSLLPGTTQMIVEHRMYLASIPVIALIVAGLDRWLGPRTLALWPAAAVALIVVTRHRNEAYRSSAAIWADTVAKCPDNAIAHYNLGYALGPTPQGEAEMRAAIRLKPDYTRAYDVLGYDLSLSPADRRAAMSVYRRALEIDPRDAAAANNLGNMLVREPGGFDEGTALLERAAAATRNPELYEELGTLLAARAGREGDALAALAAAVRLDPGNARAHYELGLALARDSARTGEAAAEFRTAIRLEPKLAAAHDRLGKLLAGQAGHESEALEEFRTAVRLDPGSAVAHSNLAAGLQAAGRPDAEVVSELRTAVRLDPTLVEAWVNLGMMLAPDPARRAEAADDFRTALRLRPGFKPAQEMLRQLGE